MFAVNDKMAAVCGRYGVHIQPISFSPLVELGPLEFGNNLPPGSKADPTKLSLICLDLSPTSRFLVAADSGKNVFLCECEFTPHVYWDHLTSWVMENRTAKIQFDRTGEHILITDKTGDVYITSIRVDLEDDEVGPGKVTISKPRKILVHSHHVLDVALSQDNQKIQTCSSDEMIRLWTFPTMMKLIDLDFKVDHKECIVSSSLVNRDQNLVSISADGTLKYWRVWLNRDEEDSYFELQESSNPMKRSHKGLKSWNLFTVLEAQRTHMNEVVRVASTTFEGRVYIAVQISGFKVLPVFELRPIESSLRLFGQTRLTHDYVDFLWRGKHLFVFCPEEASMCKYAVSSQGGLMKEECPLRCNSTVKKDIASYGRYNRPFFPAKKRVNSNVLETVGQSTDILPKEFGPLPTQEENEARAQANKLLLTAMSESPEVRRARRKELQNTLMTKMAERSRKKVVVIKMPETGEAGGFVASEIRRKLDRAAESHEYDYEDIQFESDDDVERIDGSSSTQESESIQTEGVDLREYDVDDGDADDEGATLEVEDEDVTDPKDK